METNNNSSLFELNGRSSLKKGTLLSLQHIMAMFVGNMLVISLICTYISSKNQIDTFNGSNFIGNLNIELIQNAVFIAGLGTLIQLYPIWKFGAKLPLVEGASFSFYGAATIIIDNCYNSGQSADYAFRVLIGAFLVGGFIEIIFGFTAKYWKRFISPRVGALVILSFGLSLLPVAAGYFGGGKGTENFGSLKFLLVGLIALVSCIIWKQIFKKSFYGQLDILIGIAVGYVFAIILGLVDWNVFKGISKVGYYGFYVPMPFAFTKFLPIFDLNAVLIVAIIYLATMIMSMGNVGYLGVGLRREATGRELSGALMCNGAISIIASVFGGVPTVTFAQNVQIVNDSKIINRFALMPTGIMLIIISLLTPFGTFLCSIPQAVIGGVLVLIFGSIISGSIGMLSKIGLNARNSLIIALSLSIGFGFSLADGIYSHLPTVISSMLKESIACTFIIAMILDCCLPKDKEVKQNNEIRYVDVNKK